MVRRDITWPTIGSNNTKGRFYKGLGEEMCRPAKSWSAACDKPREDAEDTTVMGRDDEEE